MPHELDLKCGKCYELCFVLTYQIRLVKKGKVDQKVESPNYAPGLVFDRVKGVRVPQDRR